MKKLLMLPVLCVFIFGCRGQVVKQYRGENGVDVLPKYTGPVGRVNTDTFAWRLWKIEKDTFYYSRLISFINIDSNGWSYCIWQADREYKQDRYLYLGTNVFDTIPQVQHHIMYDEEKKMFAEWDEWWIGGLMGILARRSENKYKKL